VSTFENMVICVEILLSLDISVKYAQCVKIWMFLNCVHLPEVLCSVSGEMCLSGEEKDNVPTEQVSHILVKGDTRCEGTSPFYLICTKKESPIDYSPREWSLRQHAGCPLALICQMYLCQRSPSGPVQEAPRGAQAL
jgi:hypothetical protein